MHRLFGAPPTVFDSGTPFYYCLWCGKSYHEFSDGHRHLSTLLDAWEDARDSFEWHRRLVRELRGKEQDLVRSLEQVRENLRKRESALAKLELSRDPYRSPAADIPAKS